MSSQQTTEASVVDQESTGRDWKIILSSGVMGLIAGLLAALAMANVGSLSLIAFVIAAGGVSYYLYQKPLATISIGTGFYFHAALLAIAPLLFYIPTILSPGEGAEGAGTFIGSILGFVLWGFGALVFAIVLAALGYFINRRGKKKLDASTA
jgi:hypothetical protein